MFHSLGSPVPGHNALTVRMPQKKSLIWKCPPCTLFCLCFSHSQESVCRPFVSPKALSAPLLQLQGCWRWGQGGIPSVSQPLMAAASSWWASSAGEGSLSLYHLMPLPPTSATTTVLRSRTNGGIQRPPHSRVHVNRPASGP